jgi:hypothetical protein
VTPVTPITIVFALAAMVAMLLLSPGRALGVIIASMLIWPEYLRIPVGLAQMSVPRLAALALIARMLVRGGPTQVRWNWIDAVIALGWVWDLAANQVEGGDPTQSTYMIGRVFDTVCMYFAARLSLRGERDYAGLFVPTAIAGVALGILGVMEAAMSRSLYEHLYAYGGPAWFDKDAEYRYGFLRARASTGHPIYFGMAMTVVTGMVYAMRGSTRWRSVWAFAVAVSLLGLLSSLSSGPQLALVVLLITSCFMYAKRLIRPAVVALLVLCTFVELASNRHFYQLIDYLAMNSETAWYRGRLLEVAISHLSEYWAFGVGAQWPHHWGAEIDTRLHVDVVNHYIIVALYGGLPSLACYVGAIVGSVRAAAMVASSGPSSETQRLGFGLACTLIAIAVASMSVGLFGPPLLLTYILMGSMVALPAAVGLGHARHSEAMLSAPEGTPLPGNT